MISVRKKNVYIAAGKEKYYRHEAAFFRDVMGLRDLRDTRFFWSRDNVFGPGIWFMVLVRYVVLK